MLLNKFHRKIFCDSECQASSVFNVLPYCTDRMDYAFLKYEFEDMPIIPKLFLKDINFSVDIMSDAEVGMFSLGQLKNNIFKKNIHKPEKLQPIDLITKLLSQGNIVLIQTVSQMLPFFKHYDPNFNIDLFSPGHVFMAVGCENGLLYYLEVPQDINWENFYPYKYNEEIGVVEIQHLEKAFNCYLSCFTYDVSRNELESYCKSSDRQYLQNVIKNYDRCSIINEQYTNIVGYAAFNILIKVCQKESLLLNNRVPLKKNLSYSYLFEWQLKAGINARKILKMHLQQNSYQNSDVIIALNCSINNLEILKNILIKNEIKGKSLFGNEYVRCFYEIVGSEDYLMNELKKIIVEDI